MTRKMRSNLIPQCVPLDPMGHVMRNPGLHDPGLHDGGANPSQRDLGRAHEQDVAISLC